MKVGAFADTTKKSMEPLVMIPNVPFCKLLTEKSVSQLQSDTINSDDSSNNKSTKIPCKDEDQNGNSPKESKTEVIMVSTNDDFIMVDLVNFNLLQWLHEFEIKIGVFVTINC